MTTRAETIAKTAAVFNSAADHFDHPVLDFWDRFGQHTIDRLDLEAGDRVLDVCCGTGALAIPAAVRVSGFGLRSGRVSSRTSQPKIPTKRADKHHVSSRRF
jgi:ubiquinone/menaquinone biosynthesis C-methylase UbiE